MEKSQPLRVLLAEDHALVRAGFRAILNGMDGVEVVAEAKNGYEAVELVRTKRPDLVLMDIAMPGFNGLEATARIIGEFPHIRVMILSMHANEEYVYQSLKAGAKGYLLKDADLPELKLAIATVGGGKPFLSPAISRHVIEHYLKRQGPETGPFEVLTPRQREILQLIAEGYSTKEVAVKLDLSVKTVDSHRTQIMKRLDIHDVTGLVRYAMNSGMINSGFVTPYNHADST